MSVQILCPFLNWVVCFAVAEFQDFFNIFWRLPPTDKSFANIFPHSVGCLLIYWWCSLCIKLFGFNEVYFIFFFLLPLVLLVSYQRMFNFLWNWQTIFPKWLHYLIFPPAMHESCFFICLPTFVICFFWVSVFYCSHSSGYELFLIVALICISLMIIDFEHLFMYSFTIYIFYLVKA